MTYDNWHKPWWEPYSEFPSALEQSVANPVLLGTASSLPFQAEECQHCRDRRLADAALTQLIRDTERVLSNLVDLIRNPGRFAGRAAIMQRNVDAAALVAESLAKLLPGIEHGHQEQER